MIDFAALKVDALLVSALPNVRYLTGFTGSNGIVLLTPDSQTLFTDPRYTIQAGQQCSCKVRTVRNGPLTQVIAQAIDRRKWKRIGFEKARLTYEAYEALKNALPVRADLRPVPAVIERLRMIKSEDEIARIRAAVQTNSRAFERALRIIREGVTETDIAAEIEYQMRRLGADKPAFETIVASGPRTALVHAHPAREHVTGNALVLIDMGACQDGYTSDMTRMVHVGQPSGKVRSMYNAVLNAQLAAIDAVRPGITARAVDAAARKSLKSKALDKAFVHSTGHGLGLEIHEAPRLGKKDNTRLEAGMVITIEPGVYQEGFGGIRIEDTVLVTEKGSEVLTPTSKELVLV